MATVKDIIDPTEVQKDLEISGLNLSGDMIKQASLYGYYAAKAQSAQKQELKFKQLRDLAIAKADQEIRSEAAEKGEKLTEKKIEGLLNARPSVVSAIIKYNDAKSTNTLIANVLEALKQRRDMLIQLGSNAREERKGELRLNRHSPEARRASVEGAVVES